MKLDAWLDSRGGRRGVFGVAVGAMALAVGMLVAFIVLLVESERVKSVLRGLEDGTGKIHVDTVTSRLVGFTPEYNDTVPDLQYGQLFWNSGALMTTVDRPSLKDTVPKEIKPVSLGGGQAWKPASS